MPLTRLQQSDGYSFYDANEQLLFDRGVSRYLKMAKITLEFKVHPWEIGTPLSLWFYSTQSSLSFAAVGYFIFRGSNSQKNEFRKNPQNPALARKCCFANLELLSSTKEIFVWIFECTLCFIYYTLYTVYTVCIFAWLLNEGIEMSSVYCSRFADYPNKSWQEAAGIWMVGPLQKTKLPWWHHHVISLVSHLW